LQLPGPDAGVDLQRPCKQRGVVGSRRVQPAATYPDRSALDVVAGQCTVLEDRPAGGQGDAAGVEEAATIDMQAGRIGDHDLRTIAPDLDVAIEMARTVAVDLVKDDPRGTRGQVRIAIDPATQLRLRRRARIVEDRALLAHVELAVDVARDPGLGRRGY